MTNHQKLRKFLSLSAAAVALLVMLLPPLGYFLLNQSNLRVHLEHEAQIASIELSRFATAQDNLWQYQSERMIQTMEPVRDRDHQYRVVNGTGREIALLPGNAAAPNIGVSAPIYLFGLEAGKVEISETLVPILKKTVIISALSGTLGLLIFFPLRLLPLRALSHATESLAESEARYRSVFHAVHDGIMMVDQNCAILAANPQAAAIFDLDAQKPGRCVLREMETRMVREDGKPWPAGELPVHLTLATGKPQTDVILGIRAHGHKTRWYLTSTQPMWRAGEVLPYAVAVSFADITSQRRSRAQMEFLAHHDALTRLPNRRDFQAKGRELLAHARRQDHGIAILFVDLDMFKHVNDSLGHDAGDQLLQIVSRRLHGCLRETDLLARWGGDEFVLLLNDLKDAHNASQVAQKILDTLAEPVHLHGSTLRASCTIGISCYPADGRDMATLLKCADTAMYVCKEKGRNQYGFFSPEMNARAHEHVTLGSELRRALQENQFELVYQPQVNLATNGVVGVEALIRWRHPERGMVSPAVFIPLAESLGLINSIGEWVLNSACRQMRAWLDEGLPMERVAVNLSVHQFRQSHLVDGIRAALREADLPPCHLEVEITESALMENTESARHMLLELVDMGVSVAIDDFGTGYSSLAYLSRFPISYLKIDQSFVRDLSWNLDDRVIVRTIIALARSLHINVIAEGVETEEQRDFLRSEQCDHIQGYFYSKPRPAQELSHLLRPARPGLKLVASGSSGMPSRSRGMDA